MTRQSDVARVVRSKIEELGAVLDDALRGAGDRAGDLGERVRGRSRELLHTGRTRAKEIGHEVEEIVREKPVASLLVAAGVAACAGLLAGMLWKRK